MTECPLQLEWWSVNLPIWLPEEDPSARPVTAHGGGCPASSAEHVPPQPQSDQGAPSKDGRERSADSRAAETTAGA